MAQSGYLTQIAKSRTNLLEILESRGFDITNHANESVSQVNFMLQNEQLDMLVVNPKTEKKAYVKYHLGKTLRANNIMDYIDDLYTLDSVLSAKDDLIIVARESSNESMLKALRHIWAQQKYLITVFGIKSLQFNVLKHSLVPPHRVLTERESTDIKVRYNIQTDGQMPDISRFGPEAMAIGIRPGEMCEILRPSKTAISAPFYRICSP